MDILYIICINILFKYHIFIDLYKYLLLPLKLYLGIACIAIQVHGNIHNIINSLLMHMFRYLLLISYIIT